MSGTRRQAEEVAARAAGHGGSDPDRRVHHFTQGADLTAVSDLLTARRDEVLERWLAATTAQPFHADRASAAVADDIPDLFDALVALLQRGAARESEPGPPQDDSAVIAAAQAHARARFRQGLAAPDVLTEFRLLRQEIGRALRLGLGSQTQTGDALAAELLVHDGLDGASYLALAALTEHEAERRRLADELSVTRQRLEAILDQIPSGLVLAEAPSGKILLYNNEAERLLRHPVVAAESYHGYTDYAAVHADGGSYTPEEYPLTCALFGETTRDYELCYRRGDGTYTWFSVNAAPIRDQAGTIIAAVTIFTDIGERKRLQAERAAFFARLGHDIKNPLAAIKSLAQLLLRQVRRGDVPADILSARLTAIDDSTGRALRRLEGLLDVVRDDHSQSISLHREPTDLLALVNRLVLAYQVTTEQHQLVVETGAQAAGDTLVGWWDSGRLERVIDNLLANAIKYSPNGGAITVRVCRETARADASAGPLAVVSVTDEGIGIPAADLLQLFEQFHRASNAQDYPGTGLGLWAVRQIVELHGGTISVDSREGQGSTFTVRLPEGGRSAP